MTTIIGIDLGTTYSTVAYVNELGQPEILTNRDGERLTPSVVMFQDEEPLVGKMAKHSAAMAPDDVVQFVKRFMGDSAWVHYTQTGDAFRPEEVSALILKRLKEDAEYTLGKTVTDAVITVPAYFDDARRKATRDAVWTVCCTAAGSQASAPISVGLVRRLQSFMFPWRRRGPLRCVTGVGRKESAKVKRCSDAPAANGTAAPTSTEHAT